MDIYDSILQYNDLSLQYITISMLPYTEIKSIALKRTFNLRDLGHLWPILEIYLHQEV